MWLSLTYYFWFLILSFQCYMWFTFEVELMRWRWKNLSRNKFTVEIIRWLFRYKISTHTFLKHEHSISKPEQATLKNCSWLSSPKVSTKLFISGQLKQVVYIQKVKFPEAMLLATPIKESLEIQILLLPTLAGIGSTHKHDTHINWKITLISQYRN